jgi:hypothetical protein
MRLLEFLDKENALINRLRVDCSEFINVLKKSNEKVWRGTHHSIGGIQKFVPRSDRKPKDTNIWVHNLLNKEFLKKFGWKVRNGVFATSDKNEILIRNYGIPYLFFPVNGFKFVWSPDIGDLTVAFGRYATGKLSGQVLKNYATPGNYSKEQGPRFGKGKWVKITKPFIKKPWMEDYLEYGREWIKNDLVWQPEMDFEKWQKEKTAGDLKGWNRQFGKRFEDLVDSFKDTDLLSAIKSKHEISFNCEQYYLVNEDYGEKW